jgi:hypothetical protein
MSSLPARPGSARAGVRRVERQEQKAADLDRDVRAREQKAVLPERFGDGDCHREAREHHREQKEAHRDRVRVDLARDPRRVVPRPPDDEEREQRVAGSGPAQVVEQQLRELRDREDEDEVVEELERGCVLLLTASSTRVPAHRRAGVSDSLRDALLESGRHGTESTTGGWFWSFPEESP